MENRIEIKKEGTMKERPILFSAAMVRAILSDRKLQTRRVVKNPRIDFIDSCEAAYQTGDGDWIFWSRDSPNAAEFTKKAYPTGGIKCPYGRIGDQLWLRESFYAFGRYAYTGKLTESGKREIEFLDFTVEAGHSYLYPADCLLPKTKKFELGWHKRPSIFMPRAASRITLEITDIRVERLQDISEQDAIAEGIQKFDYALDSYALVQGREVHEYFYGTKQLAPSCMEKTAKEAYRRLWDSINRKTYPWDSNSWVWVVDFKRLIPK